MQYFSNRRPDPVGNVYARPSSRVEYQIFSEDYFSGADVHLYFGDIWVDEVTNINFSLQEEVLPIYGYHSYTFDTVARGKRMVQGSFSINFKSIGYLQAILDNALAIDYMLNDTVNKDMIRPEDFSKYKLDDILLMYGKDSFEQIASEYEKALWGLQGDDKQHLSYGNKSFFPKDRYGFDIKINYGAVSESLDPDRLPYFSAIRHAPKPNLTVETINGVQLIGMSKAIGTEQQGAPITETYSFIARDLNGPLYKR